jgi:hypothetical protein
MVVNKLVLDRPLYPWGHGDLQYFRFGRARSNHFSDNHNATINPIDQLRASTNMKLVADPAAVAAGSRAQLRTLIADPDQNADDVGFALPEVVFEDVRVRGLQPGDRDLIQSIVADPRTRNFNNIFQVVQAFGKDATRLRDPIVARLLVGGADSSADRALGRALSWLPPGVFAEPTSQELALMTDPERRDNAIGLFERQADRGPEAAPFLLNVLADVFRRRALMTGRSGLELDRDTVEGIRHALAALGPKIVPERPRLAALLATQPGREGRRQTFGWEVALVRMGASPDSFKKPSELNGSEAAYHEALRRDVNEFERNLAKRH